MYRVDISERRNLTPSCFWTLILITVDNSSTLIGAPEISLSQLYCSCDSYCMYCNTANSVISPPGVLVESSSIMCWESQNTILYRQIILVLFSPRTAQRKLLSVPMCSMSAESGHKQRVREMQWSDSVVLCCRTCTSAVYTNKDFSSYGHCSCASCAVR